MPAKKLPANNLHRAHPARFKLYFIRQVLSYFLLFGIQQALSCIFPVIVFASLALSHYVPIMPRYDFVLLMCLSAQFTLYLTGVETRDEVKVICIFHILGLTMELFKVHVGSWSYPEFAWTKFGGVPLYSGFMYASVASYMCQAWRRFNLQMQHWPPALPVSITGALIYLNFFSNHFMPDIRYVLGIYVCYLFRRSWVVFHVRARAFRMPVTLSFLLIGCFIWLAENIATLLGAWKYAYQHNGWAMVNYQKISSWAFLVIVSYIIVTEMKMVKKYPARAMKRHNYNQLFE